MQPTAHTNSSCLPTHASSAVLHPPCVYSAAQRNTGPLSPAILPTQGNKVNEWQAKNKPQGHQQRTQRQFLYTSKPSFPFEHSQIAPPPPTSPSPYLLASSNFCHAPYSPDHYNNLGVTLLSQPYLKPPEMQALCLVHDRQVISQQQSQQYNPYYNLSATNACTLQAVTTNTNLLPNQMGSYAPFANNQLPLPNHIFHNSAQNPIINSPKETRPSASAIDFPPLKYPRSQLNDITGKIPSPLPALSRENTDWPSQIGKMSATFNIPSTDYKEFCAEIAQNSQANSSSKTQEERFSDESSASFDFTIEAEKMVSALCNTNSLNDLVKIGTGKNESSIIFSGAGDNISGKHTWFPSYTANNAKVESSSGKSVATQTQEPNSEKYPELIRKTTLWGCSQAESLLNSGGFSRNYKNEWLVNLSAATRTAITKSATCFSVFAGDRIFLQDLINSLLRISNGWLILDNYLNKQHYPSLNDKYDKELVKSFQDWEGSTYELLKNINKTFLYLEKKISGQEEKKTSGTSGTFPGDISMYTTRDFFESPLSKTSLVSGSSMNQENQNIQNFHYLPDQKKETKLKGKWTITENVSSGLENSKNPDVFLNRLDAGIHVSRLRTKGNVSSIKSTSLNAEFFHLRNKVLENKSPDSNKWHLKERKPDININRESKPLDSVFRLKFGSENQDACSSQLSRIGPIFSNSPGNMDPLYVNTNNSDYSTCIDKKGCFDPNCESNLRPMLSKPLYLGHSSSDQLEFAGIPINKMTLLSQIEPNTVVTNKEEMTANLCAWFASMRNVNITGNLDLKIENLTRNSKEVTRNTMDMTRQLQLDGNRQLLSLQNMQSIQSAPWNACNLLNNRASVQQTHEEYDSSEDIRIYMKPGSYNVPKKRHQKRSNRRSENAASRLGIRNLNKERPDTSACFASSRVVTMNNIDTKTSSNFRITFPTNPSVSSSCTKTAPRNLHKSDSPSEDVTWKAACASAEILLEALHVKKLSPQVEDEKSDEKIINLDQKVRDQDRIIRNQDEIFRSQNQMFRNQDQITYKENQKIRDQMIKNQDEMIINQDQIIRNQGQQQRHSKSRKQREDDDCDASSYEASEDDSESSVKIFHGIDAVGLKRNNTKLGKTNVKTDSWLIRTLNNASIMETSQCREDEVVSSDSLNSSFQEDELNDRANVVTSTLNTPTAEKIRNISPKKLFPNFLKKEVPTENVGKATYSETVRRSAASLGKKEISKKEPNSENEFIMCGTILPLPGKKSHRKDVEKSYLLHKSRKAIAKKILKDQKVQVQREDSLKMKNPEDETSLGDKSFLRKGHGKRKDTTVILDGKNKNADRGWSVWYSSKRKQMSPLTLSKLEAIHQTLWQMEEACVFKYPSSTGVETSTSSNTIEDCCQIVKNPMFLETIGYKLKNRVYNKVEHAVKDFRRIVHYSKLYHKNDGDFSSKIDKLSKKLEELFVEHFGNLDFENAMSPRDESPVSRRVKLPSQRTRNIRRKSPSVSGKTVNVHSNDHLNQN
ncbi:uncharacterized protein LOC117181444 isoform X2 [Belonocnema kinseyi]|uniref:uncharacterized protein LOC117181444 isoform X2 n=1 Tax=Belonocnema kinseyi TaxID=2817044 RepID=UPI00143CFDC1|nr:uncharacterized protein LOC117181444 isoform X2 [Belonocnema kinseyi]